MKEEPRKDLQEWKENTNTDIFPRMRKWNLTEEERKKIKEKVSKRLENKDMALRKGMNVKEGKREEKEKWVSALKHQNLFSWES